jgi:hypothetical protein
MPWHCLADADRVIFGEPTNPQPHRRALLDEYIAYAEEMVGKWGSHRQGGPDPNVRKLIKPLLGLFHGERGNRVWKHRIDEYLKDHPECTQLEHVVAYAATAIPEEVMMAPPGAFVPDVAYCAYPLRDAIEAEMGMGTEEEEEEEEDYDKKKKKKIEGDVTVAAVGMENNESISSRGGERRPGSSVVVLSSSSVFPKDEDPNPNPNPNPNPKSVFPRDEDRAAPMSKRECKKEISSKGLVEQQEDLVAAIRGARKREPTRNVEV